MEGHALKSAGLFPGLITPPTTLERSSVAMPTTQRGSGADARYNVSGPVIGCAARIWAVGTADNGTITRDWAAIPSHPPTLYLPCCACAALIFILVYLMQSRCFGA